MMQLLAENDYCIFWEKTVGMTAHCTCNEFLSCAHCAYSSLLISTYHHVHLHCSNKYIYCLYSTTTIEVRTDFLKNRPLVDINEIQFHIEKGQQLLKKKRVV
ncbi:uncharacterized protein [Fopius arisanus]|uniref:Uncharacterized protein isoform X1 n=1 Tax=Fopius arisanus TaxID=64838 RepID=A0A9R1T0A6_9HYME|nr:PREDICTED: uncharacterized protein LOC105264943 isoform X1 [Fopius arisanus]